MNKIIKRSTALLLGLTGLVGLALGWFLSSTILVVLSAVVLCYCFVRCVSRWKKTRGTPPAMVLHESSAVAAAHRRQTRQPAAPADPGDSDSLTSQMIVQGRYALLVRPQIARDLSAAQLSDALAALDSAMAPVPTGKVLMRCEDAFFDSGAKESQDRSAMVSVESFFLDRYPITNEQYQNFVLAGGYEQMALWEKEIWPAVLDFVDRTRYPGPRFWHEGNYPRGKHDHPVVGISWHEASAYARWVGKRLPTDPEWVKAACWPVPVRDGPPIQRKFSWGDSMDRRMANLWASGRNDTVPVTEYADGVSVGGACQIIGNVWEWTTSRYGQWHPHSFLIESPERFRSIRGGAFDTYFDSQATCHFQSCDLTIARKHNIGFRCALGMCDVAQLGAVPETTQSSSCEPVATAACGGEEIV